MMPFPAWTPFLDPIPIWANAVWPWLLLPLTAAVALVYKSIKCRTMRQVPRKPPRLQYGSCSGWQLLPWYYRGLFGRWNGRFHRGSMIADD